MKRCHDFSKSAPKRKRVYIAGPMRGLPQHNFPAFHAAADLWRTWGWEVVSPAEIDQKLDGFDGSNPEAEKPFHVVMRRDIEAILTVDAIAFLPGFERSQGSKIEHMVGATLSLDMYDALTGARLLSDIQWEQRVA
jgi:uncharacterized protein DUF4406